MSEMEPTKLHRILGVLTFVVVMIIGALDGLPWYSISPHVMAVFTLIFLILIGFGTLVETWVRNR